MKLSEEERKRRSELAKQLHQKGQFGGKQQGAGRPKKERAQEEVAELIRDEGQSIFKALKDALKSDSPSIKLKAALAMLDIETKEAEHKIKEEQRMYDNASKDKLLELISERMKQLSDAGVNIPGFDFDLPNTEVKEIESGDS